MITTFGYTVFHLYERYAWVPQIVVISILAGVAGPKFDLTTNPSEGEDSLTIKGNRLSFFSLCLAAAITYSGGAADLFVYYPEYAPRRKVFIVTLAGLAASFTYAFVVGIGLGSGIALNQVWSDAYSVSQGALIVEGFNPLGAFGSFCSVVVAIGLVGNIILPVYAAGVDFQILGHNFEKIPRVIWNTFGVIIFTVCALLVNRKTKDVLVHADRLLEIVSRKSSSLGVLLVRQPSRGVQLREQLVRLDCDGRTGTVGATHVVCDVFRESDSLDG